MILDEELPTVHVPVLPTFQAIIVAHAVIVRLRGAADANAVKELQIHLMYLTSLRPVEVILDFTEVGGIGLAAINALARFRATIVRGGGSVRLIGLTIELFEVFARAGLADTFGIKRDADETWLD